MKRTKFTESEIVAAIKKQETGVSTKEVCRELLASARPRFTIGKPGMVASDVKRLKDLEAELNQYKQMYAEVSFKLQATQNLIAKKF